MITIHDVKKLSELARISIDENEAERLRGDLGAILEYVAELKKSGSDDTLGGEEDLVNIMRKDELFHAPGRHTEKLLSAAPRREDSYVIVRQIIEK